MQMQIPKSKTKCPAHSGEGINRWINARIVFLDARKVDHDVIRRVLQEETAHCDRDTTQDIDHSLETVGGVVGHRTGFKDRFKRMEANKPTAVLDDVKRVDTIDANRKWTVQQWLDECKWNLVGCEDKVLLDVFDGGETLVCIGATKKIFRTDRLGQFLRQERLETLQYIVPNPMAKEWGRTKDRSHDSMHWLENVGPRWFLVVEFDNGSVNEQCALHHHLAGLRRLVMLVSSGNKSIHGWYRAGESGESRGDLEFMNEAQRLGADPRMWTPSQFTRCPGGTNSSTGKRQQLIYFN
jgi:hypothetical protein